MSSIPSSKMKHAHAHEGEHPEQSQPAGGSGGQPSVGDVGSGGGDTKAPPKAGKNDGTGAKLSAQAKKLAERAEDLAEEAVDAVKARPKTAVAIGAALVAGAAAIVGGPAAARALKGDDDEKKPVTKSKGKKADKA